MDAYTQDQRRLQIDTVLGKDHVLLVSVRGRDVMSESYSYDLEVASLDHDIKPDDMLAKPITFRIYGVEEQHATVNGFVSHFAVLGREVRELCFYRVRVVPSLWFLTRGSDCRIFQERSVPQIVDMLLTEHGIIDKAWRLANVHAVRNYCVQYRETTYDFICRLLEEEGIFFYFQHDHQAHTVVFTDNNHGLAKCADAQVTLAPVVGAQGRIWQWDSNYRFRSSKWALSDYNFETPSTNLTATKETLNSVLKKRPFEQFDYPGRYLKKSPGEDLTKLRIEYEEATYQEITGEGGCIGFAAGTYFSVSNTDAREANKEYVIRSVEHTAEDWTLVTRDAEPAAYSNRFRCALNTVPYRPERKTPSPRIHGTQTAVVTGPSGSEIFTDEYGRIKVQFHWDRKGRKDEHSSCWVRVAQTWAGRGWGGWYVPRIGQEVVVAFLEGDPDRPLVVGSVYNAEQTVPFSLPGNATQSGVRTRSSMGGSAATCNEFRFEDKKGAEQVYFHAERDLDTSVELDETHSVGHDQCVTIGHDRTKKIGNDETTLVGDNRTETVGNNEAVTIGQTRTHTIGTIDTLTVGAARIHTVGATETITVAAEQTIAVDASQDTTVGTSQSTSVGSDRSVSVGGDQSISVGGSEAYAVGKDRSTSVGQSDSLDVGKSLTITAGDQIVLQTGSATITMKKNGDITIEGKQITIKGSGDVVIKGQKILQN